MIFPGHRQVPKEVLTIFIEYHKELEYNKFKLENSMSTRITDEEIISVQTEKQ